MLSIYTHVSIGILAKTLMAIKAKDWRALILILEFLGNVKFPRNIGRGGGGGHYSLTGHWGYSMEHVMSCGTRSSDEYCVGHKIHQRIMPSEPNLQ